MRSGEPIDDGLVLWFPGPGSYTGEDVAEFHVHGGRAVLGAMAQGLSALGLRPAEPGEFTRRAFLNGKLDLTEAEGILDLVNAETEAQRRLALRQAGGELRELYEGWRQRLLLMLAEAEAEIDFPDEDLPEGLIKRSILEAKNLADEVERHLNDQRRGERLREGYQIAILGAPNVGKSSLLNRLAQRDAAIVSATPGTTRDVVQVQMDLGGYPVTLADTAGLREVSDEVESEGIRRALAVAGSADLKLVVFDATARPVLDPEGSRFIDDRSIIVINKIDEDDQSDDKLIGDQFIRLSAITGHGIDNLINHLTIKISNDLSIDSPTMTRTRHRNALTECLACLRRATGATLPELFAEDVRLAARQLGRITGMISVDDVLDAVFRQFCIGK